MDLRLAPNLFHEQFPLSRGGSKLPSHHTSPIYDFDLCATYARTLLPAALASASFGFVLVRVRIRCPLYDFDLCATHARTLQPTALESVSFGFVLVRVRVTSREANQA